MESEKRKYPRLNITGREYGISFQAQGQEVQGCHLLNLSEGGCGLEVQMAIALGLDLGDVIEDLYLDHPDLPFVPMTATILRMLGKVPGKTSGYVLMGLEFQELTPFVRGLIAAHVEEQLAGE